MPTVRPLEQWQRLTKPQRLDRSASSAAKAKTGDAWFRAMADQMGEGIVVCDGISDGDWRFTFANRLAAEILAHPGADLTGASLDMYVAPEELERLMQERQRVASGLRGRPVTYTVRKPGQDPRVISVSDAIAPLPGIPGKLRVIKTLRDITTEHQRETALADARQQIERTLDVAPGVFFRTLLLPGEIERLTFVSGALPALFGVAVEDAMQPGFGAQYTGFDVGALRREALAKAGQDQIASLEYSYERSGRMTWVNETIRAIQLPNGGTEYVGFAANVTASRAIETALRETESDLLAAIQLGPGVLYRARLRDGKVTVLAAHGDATRISSQLLPGESHCEKLSERLSQPENVASLLRVLEQAFDEPASFDYSKTRDGHTRWLRNMLRCTGKSEDQTDIVGYILDVTREKEAQIHLQHVTTLVTLGEMATGMAHELNQPLASVNFAAQNLLFMLGTGRLDIALLAAKAEKISQETRRASKLVEHMRVFARNEREAPRPVSWRSALDGAREILTPRLRGFQLRDELPDGLPDVLGVPIPMEQVIINLLSNAMDAYDSAAAYVAARPLIVNAEAAGRMVALRIADRAGGIPPAVISRVFEPFFTTKSPGKGTGLGLALSFGTVVELGGTIAVRNEHGGAVFEVRLPAA